MKRTIKRMLGLALTISACATMPAMAQNQGGFQQGQGGGFGGGGGRGFDPTQIQQTMNDSIREALSATDQEWSVLGPKIQNIQQLQNNAGGGLVGSMNSMMRMFSRRMQQGGGQGGQGGPGAQGGRGGMPNIAQMMGIKDSVMQQKMQDLQSALENPDTPEAQIKQKLDGVREARDRARAELDRARKELIDLLTTRQEAILFGMGVLE